MDPEPCVQVQGKEASQDSPCPLLPHSNCFLLLFEVRKEDLSQWARSWH